MVEKIDSEDSLEKIINSGDIVVIDAYADWCGPCKKISPYFEQLAEEFSSSGIKFYKINIDEIQIQEVSALPTFLVYKNSEIIDKFEGANTQGLKNMVNKLK